MLILIGYQRILITDNKLRIEIDKFELNFDGYFDEDSYRIETKINYCPMCGRKLEGRQEVDKWVSDYRFKKITYYDRVRIINNTLENGGNDNAI